MDKTQFNARQEIVVKQFVAKMIPSGGSEHFLRRLIFGESVITNWKQVAGLICQMFPEQADKLRADIAAHEDQPVNA